MREETSVVEVDRKGRVQIPRSLRQALDIYPGALVRITVSEPLPKKQSESRPLMALAAPALEAIPA
jgi:bifunctional DNA-binding transcriptional regulator/antitoxin component of YhaV-PrlF toxin-antitoxin module